MGKKTLRIAAAGCVLALAAVGCGHESGTGAAPSAKAQTAQPGTPSASASTSAAPVSASKVLSEGQLEQAGLTGSDLPGFQVAPLVGDGSDQQPTVVAQRPPSPAQCAPLNNMTEYLGRFQPVWQVVKAIAAPGKNNIPSTTVALASYKAQDAATVMTELHGALADCTRFAPPQPSEGLTFTHIQKLSAPAMGDDAISYRMTQNTPTDNVASALSVVYSYLVVRTGTTVTTFVSNYTGANSKPADVPQEIIDTQLKKLT
ncbi:MULTISPECIES: hypothetical protein [unclassified Streptomyces]|uniref:hypothetical protein n=1 Tax=unclassified Streptomyces TaxID=2593676 RepID=UPI000B845DF8|nr:MULTISPECIES: hypothetical protein [unclassified Streptomyces]MYS25065.1 hypothetical protein [Streptomyces sp. SID4948]